MSLQPRISRALPTRRPKTREGDSRAHIALIMKLPCAVPGCGSETSEPHHLLRVDNLPKGTARKNEDRWAIPLCFRHHMRTVSKTDCAHGDHGDDEAWLLSKGIHARDLAEALWSCRNKPDPEEACRRVVWRAKQGRAG